MPKAVCINTDTPDWNSWVILSSKTLSARANHIDAYIRLLRVYSYEHVGEKYYISILRKIQKGKTEWLDMIMNEKVFRNCFKPIKEHECSDVLKQCL